MRLEIDPITALSSRSASHSGQDISAEAHEALQAGIKAAQAGDRPGARATLLHAASLDPRSETAWLWLASISEYPEELMVFLNNVLEINPENARALEWMTATKALLARTFVQRGIDAAEEGNTDFAAECFNKALEYDQQNAMAWMWLASLSDSEEGKINYLEKVLEIEPGNEGAKKALAKAKNALNVNLLAEAKASAFAGKRNDAVELIDQIIAVTPECTDAWILKAHMVDGFDEKIKCYESVLKYDPSNAAALAGRDSLKAIFGSGVSANEDMGTNARVFPAGKPADKASGLVKEPVHFDLDDEFEDPLREEPVPVPEVSFDDASVSSSPMEWKAAEKAFTPISDDKYNAKSQSPVNDGSYDAGRMLFESTPDEFSSGYIPMPEAPLVDGHYVPTGFETRIAPIEHSGHSISSAVHSSSCPYCGSINVAQGVACGSCQAVLTLSDLEMLLANQRADKEVLQRAVEKIEFERSHRALTENELFVLGIGHLNLRNLHLGYSYLYEASQLNPNNIVLGRQVHALLIRIDEILKQQAAHPQLPRGKKILVVDDSPTIRKLISGKLQKCGHEVICSNDGVEALESLQNLIPDLVLLDITMPRMDGYQVCKQIRATAEIKDIPVVMISGKDGFFDKVRGRMAGATGYITKPFGPETLMKAVEMYLGGHVDENLQ